MCIIRRFSCIEQLIRNLRGKILSFWVMLHGIPRKRLNFIMQSCMYVKKEILFLRSELEEKAGKLLMMIAHRSVYYLFHGLKVPMFGANLTFAVPEYVDGSLA
jgi:hypothetical protein